jgi:hypothetical protein
MPIDAVIGLSEAAFPIDDQRPFNEYFFVRRTFPGFWKAWLKWFGPLD